LTYHSEGTLFHYVPEKGALMTIVIILNVVLAVAVVGGIVRLLSWAIASSRPIDLTPAVQVSPYAVRARPHTQRPNAGRPHHGASESFEPITG
jgi:hypothetical protein